MTTTQAISASSGVVHLQPPLCTGTVFVGCGHAPTAEQVLLVKSLFTEVNFLQAQGHKGC